MMANNLADPPLSALPEVVGNNKTNNFVLAAIPALAPPQDTPSQFQW
jgi:hypothetical protein